ncbi:MFS-type transporter SLC18B1 [Araneus ventricosus]|uniref:MFS-type transporter SLC18B1 n=1 Tax=Araneus ventricosus TaxID=182803 RepID=A0A4Y2AGB4_ARAVE|nr:MFS-type transporter SLC18B1 [Araneus ventricosus]
MTQALEVEQSSDKRLEAEETQQETEECITRQDLPPPLPPPRDWKRLYVIVSLTYANFWMASAFSLQAPFFPREAELKGATPTQYGFVFSVFELVIIIMSPIYGKMIPRVSPKFLITSGVLVGGIACCAFGSLDYVPAGTPYIALAFVVRIFEGFGAASLMTASFTIIAATFPDTVATSFSLMETAFGLGLIVGPTIGGALYQVGGFVTPFVVNGGFLLLGFLILSFLLPQTDAERPSGSRNLFGFLFDGGIISYTFSIITCLLFIGFNSATLEPHLRQFNLTPVILGVIFVITGAIYALTTPIWGKICDIGANPLLINVTGSILVCIGLLFIGPVPFFQFNATVWTVVGSLVVIGFGLSAKLVSSFVGALQNTVLRGFPDNLATYGMVSALFSVACSTGAFIGPSLGGLLLDTTGYRMGTVIIFALEAGFLGLLLLYILFGALKKKSDKEACERDALLPRSVARRSYSYSSV